MKCNIRINPTTKTATVTIMDDADLSFVMSEQKSDLINEYYAKSTLDHLTSYVQKINEVLGNLFEHIDELIDMTISFIEEQRVGFFTSFENIMMLECYIGALNPEIYSKVLLANDGTMQDFINNNQSYIKLNQSMVDSFFSSDFRFFQKLLNEKSKGVDIVITYLFLFNIVLQRHAIKWGEEHEKSFEDIENADLNSLIERLYLLENVDPYDIDTQGSYFYYLQFHQKFEGNNKLLDNMAKYSQLIKHHLDTKKFINFKNRLQRERQVQKYSIDDVDLMNGQEFEKFLASIFSKMGYQTEITKTSGDQGIDIIANKEGIKIGIQAKCYSGTVGNSAVQEAVAGKAFYRLDKVIVATNNFFTDSAKQLAQANGIILWDRNILKEKIAEILN
jgi:HJR/Mrr/RecB family endonuclease